MYVLMFVILGREYTREVLVLHEDRAMCRKERSECERALHILAGRRVVEVDGVGLEDIGAVGCRGVDVFVGFAGVERCVVVIADGEGDGVGSRRL